MVPPWAHAMGQGLRDSSDFDSHSTCDARNVSEFPWNGCLGRVHSSLFTLADAYALPKARPSNAEVVPIALLVWTSPDISSLDISEDATYCVFTRTHRRLRVSATFTVSPSSCSLRLMIILLTGELSDREYLSSRSAKYGTAASRSRLGMLSVGFELRKT
jgi:hypothetical protein